MASISLFTNAAQIGLEGSGLAIDRWGYVVVPEDPENNCHYYPCYNPINTINGPVSNQSIRTLL